MRYLVFLIILGFLLGRPPEDGRSTGDTDSAGRQAPLGSATVIGEAVRLRSGPGMRYPIAGTLGRGRKVMVVGRSVGWYRTEDGWVAEDYLRLDLDGRVPAGSRRALALEIAQSLLGRSYAYGQAGPDRFDCSGLTIYVYRQVGVDLPRSSESQIACGARLNRAQLAPGDLVFFDTEGGGRVSHVGIYLFDGEFVHASSGRGRVTTSTMRQGYYDGRFMGGARVLPD